MQYINFRLFATALFLIGLTGCKTNSVTDIEGNKYETVTIGTQVWMAENLRTTKYNDGTEIPNITENDTWNKMTTPAFSWYNNEPAENKKTYGALYNWYAVNTSKLCPNGWHVPADSDWMKMTSYLEDIKVEGNKLKEKGTAHWKSPNTGATNETGFTALPGGYRSIDGIFNYIGVSGYWWSATEYNSLSVLFYNIRYKSGFIYKSNSEKYCGFSVRCIRDR
jgi:uncharacterized protein (TIGR02145 family)